MGLLVVILHRARRKTKRVPGSQARPRLQKLPARDVILETISYDWFGLVKESAFQYSARADNQGNKIHTVSKARVATDIT